MTSTTLFLLAVLSFGVFLAFLAWLNVSDHKRRAKMTPEERRIDDKETLREMQIW
jgi:hypothetical protein